MLRRRPDLSITESMSKAERRIKVREARDFIAQGNFDPAKEEILSAIVGYADRKFANNGFFESAPHPGRYIRYSNIMRQADKMDAMHFMHYVVQELSRIDEFWSQSSLKQNVLNRAIRYRDAFLAPEVLKTQKAAMGLMAGGFALMMTGDSRAVSLGIPMIAAGAALYPFAYQFVLARLDRSLQLRQNQALIAGGSRQYAIQDGMTDEFSQIFGTATGMLSTGINSFGLLGRNMDRAARLAGATPQPQLASAAGGNGGPIIEEVDDEQEQRRQSMPR